MGKNSKQRREKKQRQGARRGGASGGPGGGKRARRERRPLDADDLLPPIHVDRGGNLHAPPLETLGFPADATPSLAEIRARAAELIAATPSERDPERAQAILEARRWLTDDEMALERHFGVLRLPDPAKVIEGHEPLDLDESVAPKGSPPRWSSQSRLALLMGLYALVEREIEGVPEAEEAPENEDGDPGAQLDLFDG